MEPEESQIESGFPLVSPILAMSAEFLVIFSQFLPNLCGRPPGGMHRAVYCSVPLSDWMALVMLVVLLFLIVHVICLLLLVPFSAKKKKIFWAVVPESLKPFSMSVSMIVSSSWL